MCGEYRGYHGGAWVPRALQSLLAGVSPSAKLWLGAGDCLAGESRARPWAGHGAGPWQASRSYYLGSVVGSLCWTPHVWAPLPLGERVWLRWVPGSTTPSVLDGKKLELH